MDRNRPPSASKPRRESSPNRRINTVRDIPPELRDLLATNVRETRAAGGGGVAAETSATPGRKKPLTRRTAESRPVVSVGDSSGSSKPSGSTATAVAAAGSSKLGISGRIQPKETSHSVVSPAKPLVTTTSAPARRSSAPAQESESESEDDEDGEFEDDEEIEWETVDLSNLSSYQPSA